MSTLPSGVRLVALLNDHLGEIMGRERANHTSMHLYCTGPYWVAFERSAYQLRRAFPDSETTPMRLLGYPFPVVMVSVTDRSLRSYARKHILRIDEPDYKRLTVPVVARPGGIGTAVPPDGRISGKLIRLSHMYEQQSFPRLGDYIDTLLKVTKLTKSIVCVTGGMGGSTYNALKKV